MPKTYKQRLIEVLESRIKAQQPDIDALKRNPDNNRFVNYLEVVTERRKETEAVLVECIEREADEIETAAVISALEFYADKYNYAPDISEVIGVNPGTGTMKYDISNIEADEGERAIDALKLIKR